MGASLENHNEPNLIVKNISNIILKKESADPVPEYGNF